MRWLFCIPELLTHRYAVAFETSRNSQRNVGLSDSHATGVGRLFSRTARFLTGKVSKRLNDGVAGAQDKIREPDRPHRPNLLGTVSEFSGPGMEAVRAHVPGLDQIPCKSSDLQRRNMAVCKRCIVQTSLLGRAMCSSRLKAMERPPAPRPTGA